MTVHSGWKVVLLVVSASLLAACTLSNLKGGAGNSSSTSKDNPSRSTTAFSPSNDARKDLEDAFRKLKTTYPYRLTETMSDTINGQTGPESTKVVDYAAADRSHMKLTGITDLEEITIGEKQYHRFSNGKWTESDSAAEKALKTAELRAEEMLASATKEVKYVGAETVNGVPCYAYTWSLEMNVEGQNHSGTGKAWIGVADGLLHQNNSEFKFGGYDQISKSRIVYEYNVDIRVEKPPM